MDYQFNRSEFIAPSHVKCNRTVTSRQEVAEQLAAALAECKVKPIVLPGFDRIAPRPARKTKVDPTTRLKRVTRKTSQRVAAELAAFRKEHKEQLREREQLREMVESLEVVG